MKMIFTIITVLFSLNLFAKSDIEIQEAKIRLTPPNAKVTAIFLKIVNNSDKDISVTHVTGDFAEKFELHNMEMGGGKMVMRAVAEIVVKKKSSTLLSSGGLHIMVFDLKAPLIEGRRYKIKLTLDNKTVITADVTADKM
jgi:copper(I)-binding protein